ncbi:MAG TPA: hypothetical protein VNZ22_14705 [Bacillota bacterium]|nr:hypothetical protein [Bacillota bacterium]
MKKMQWFLRSRRAGLTPVLVPHAPFPALLAAGDTAKAAKLRLLAPVLQRGLAEADTRARQHGSYLRREELLERWNRILCEARSLADLLPRCTSSAGPQRERPEDGTASGAC